MSLFTDFVRFAHLTSASGLATAQVEGVSRFVREAFGAYDLACNFFREQQRLGNVIARN